MCAVKIGRLGKFDLNPRGELWCKDENRFGHKLLSKLGWNQGKGLGKNEDGIVENLKVRMKIGNTGVGWDEKLPIGIDYQEYDAVLEDLSKMYQKPGEVINEGISLEKRSQQFKNRIHYQKFVRGKDISRYSEKDMSCIFLSKEPKKKAESTSKEANVSDKDSYPSESLSKKDVPTFKSHLSIADYFALKMKNKIGSDLNSPKETKSNKEFSQPKTDVVSKKRISELKSSQKAKQMKYELEISSVEANLPMAEENISEPSSSNEVPNKSLDFKVRFQNAEANNNENLKRKKKIKNLCNTFIEKQDVENNRQGEKNVMKENSAENKNFHFVWSQEKTPNSEKKIKNISEVSSKKRKKEKISKKAKEHCLKGRTISNVEKVSKLSESFEVGKKCLEDPTAQAVKVEKNYCKESKRHNKRTSSLRSCLSNNKYNFKQKRNVSFCENISYQIIENVLNDFDPDIVLETNEQLLSCSDEDSTDGEVINETKSMEATSVDDSITSGKSCDRDVTCPEYSDVVEDANCENSGGDVTCNENSNMVEGWLNAVPKVACFKLPILRSSNYDSWLETQRTAARMKVYQNMVKKIKKHPILRKTNLLDLKGYANWGL